MQTVAHHRPPPWDRRHSPSSSFDGVQTTASDYAGTETCHATTDTSSEAGLIPATTDYGGIAKTALCALRVPAHIHRVTEWLHASFTKDQVSQTQDYAGQRKRH